MTGPIRCHYATEPATRPDCQLVAVVRFGHIGLCASCDQHRSTLGKAQPPTPLTTATSFDVLAWIAHAQQELHNAERF
jgi:hypothetical protein